MAKSMRSKVKRHFRAKKRTDGVYAAVEAARLNRLASKLKAISTTDKEGDVRIGEEQQQREGEWEDMPDEQPQVEEPAPDAADAMQLDSGASSSSTVPAKVSTHGRRESRREEWKRSKGQPPKRGKGALATRRKAGKSQKR